MARGWVEGGGSSGAGLVADGESAGREFEDSRTLVLGGGGESGCESEDSPVQMRGEGERHGSEDPPLQMRGEGERHGSEDPPLQMRGGGSSA
jgi:hypothetical protein